MCARAGGALGMLPVKHVWSSNVNGIDTFRFERTFEIVVVISLYLIVFAKLAILLRIARNECGKFRISCMFEGW